MASAGPDVSPDARYTQSWRTEPLPVVEAALPCLADLSLRVLEDFADPFEGPVDVWTLGMESPAAHFAHLAPELSESHLDVAQSAVNCSRPAEIAPALL